jgi:hypothetical protein
MPLEEEDKLWETWDNVMEEHYWNPSIMNGAIPICHKGCALRQWLVINGEQRASFGTITGHTTKELPPSMIRQAIRLRLPTGPWSGSIFCRDLEDRHAEPTWISGCEHGDGSLVGHNRYPPLETAPGGNGLD